MQITCSDLYSFLARLQCTDTRLCGAWAGDDFEPPTGTGTKEFACQDSDLYQIFRLIVTTSEKILHNINVEVCRQVL